MIFNISRSFQKEIIIDSSDKQGGYYNKVSEEFFQSLVIVACPHMSRFLIMHRASDGIFNVPPLIGMFKQLLFLSTVL